MVFSDEDKILIKHLYLVKGYGPSKLMSEFPEKNWKRGGLGKLLKKLRETGTAERRKGSGRPKSARTEENVSAVEELALSQESQPQTHRSVRQISRETGISQSSVFRIIHADLGLKCLKKRRAQELTESNRAVRLQRAKKLLTMFPDDKVDFIWFTDEKMFTVATPRNPQNDRLYVPAAIKKKQVAAERLLHTRTTFSRSVMVSVGVSKLGFTDLIFVDPGVKINGAYYRDVLLSQQLLPVMRDVSGEFFIFQQDSAPAHRARDTVRLLEQATPAFIPPDLWPPNSPDLNPVDYKIWGIVQQRVYQTRVHNVDELKQRLLDIWHGMEQSIIDSAIDEWRGRLRACVRAKGGHFEQLL
jgi:inhibitor of nuclear factor kappa-B kinase subunit alpha